MTNRRGNPTSPRHAALRDNGTLELPLEQRSRTCAKCGGRPVYNDSPTMDWYEPCIARFVESGEGLTR